MGDGTGGVAADLANGEEKRSKHEEVLTHTQINMKAVDISKAFELILGSHENLNIDLSKLFFPFLLLIEILLHFLKEY